MKPGGRNRNTIHLPLHQNGIFELSDRLFSVIEIEQHPRLRIDRRLRRIQVFRPRLFIGSESASRESDDFALIVSDREHHAIAEFGVNSGRRFGLRAASGDLRAVGFRRRVLSVQLSTLTHPTRFVILSGAKDPLFL